MGPQRRVRKDLKYPDLSYEIIGCAMEVHGELGPGQIENFYHLALAESLDRKGISYEYKPRGTLVHRDLVADEFEADLIVEGKIIPELKSRPTGFAPDNYTQLICYLKFWQINLGLLLNFGEENLVQKRIPYDPVRTPVTDENAKQYFKQMNPENHELGQTIIMALSTLNEKYGTGYRDTTYTGLLQAEMAAEGIRCQKNPKTPLWYGNRNLGAGQLNCLLVEERCMLKVHAIYRHLAASHHAVARAYQQHLRVPLGLIVNFGRNACQILPVRNTTK